MREDCEDFLRGLRTEWMPRDGFNVSFSCFKVKCYLEGCIMKSWSSAISSVLNVGTAKTVGKAVGKGLREVFPKLTSGSQSLEVDREFGYTLCLQLWNRYCPAMTSFFVANWDFSMSFISVYVFDDGKFEDPLLPLLHMVVSSKDRRPNRWSFLLRLQVLQQFLT